MAKINWTTARQLLGNLKGWVYIDHTGTYDLIEVECNRNTHTVLITFVGKDGVERETEATDVPNDVEVQGNPAYDINGVLCGGSGRNGPVLARFVHAARAYAQTVVAPQAAQAKRPAPTPIKPVRKDRAVTGERTQTSVKPKLSAQEAVEYILYQLDAQLVSASCNWVEVRLNSAGVIKLTADGELTIGSMTHKSRTLPNVMVELAPEGQKAPRLSPFASKLYAAMQQIGGKGINMKNGDIVIDFADRPSLRLSNKGFLNVNETAISLHGLKPVVARAV